MCVCIVQLRASPRSHVHTQAAIARQAHTHAGNLCHTRPDPQWAPHLDAWADSQVHAHGAPANTCGAQTSRERVTCARLCDARACTTRLWTRLTALRARQGDARMQRVAAARRRRRQQQLPLTTTPAALALTQMWFYVSEVHSVEVFGATEAPVDDNRRCAPKLMQGRADQPRAARQYHRARFPFYPQFGPEGRYQLTHQITLLRRDTVSLDKVR